MPNLMEELNERHRQDKINSLNISQDKKTQQYRSRSDAAKPDGGLLKEIYKLYYDNNNTIDVSQTTNPNDSENANYNKEGIFEQLERNAPFLLVSNDGADVLYVLSTHDGTGHFSKERPIYPGENKTYYNIYELRLRSPTQGLAYRVTEYPICCTGVTNTGAVAALTSAAVTSASQTSPLIITSLTTAPRVAISNILNTAGFDEVSIYIHMGRDSATPFSAGINFRIEASALQAGDTQWYPVTVFTSALGSGVVLTTLAVSSLAGATSITVTAAGAIAAGNIIYLQDATLANSEFARVSAVAGNVLTLETPLTFAHVLTTTNVSNQAEMYYALIDTTSIPRLRVVVDGSGAAQNFDAEVKATYS